VRILKRTFLAPTAKGGLRKRVSERMSARKAGSPAQVEAIRKRIAELDRELAGAGRRLRSIPENLYDELAASLSEAKGERDRLAAELGQVTAKPKRAGRTGSRD
jgi:hypothetical protein